MKKTQTFKNIGRTAAVVLLAILMLSMTVMGGFSAVAAETSDSAALYESNNALLKQKYGELVLLKVENAGSAEGRSVNNYIDIYAKKINDLDTAILYFPSAAEIIELYYTQGKIAGDVAWIHFRYISEFKDEAKESIEKTHDAIQEEIGKFTNAADLKELAPLTYTNGGLYAKMYEAVFEQKLLALLLPEDSDAVKSIITGESGALSAIMKCTSSETSAQYDEIYKKAASDVTLQRNKDKATKELTDIFAILFPDTDLAGNNVVRNALSKINSNAVTLPSEMNAEVKNATKTLLGDINSANGTYLTVYFASLFEKLDISVSAANEKSEIADLSAIFGNYAIDFARASAKDTIAADIAAREYKNDSTMLKLVSEYNAANGIIDNCQTVSEVEFETFRAKLRADLYGKYVDTVATIDKWVGDDKLKTDAYNQYDYANYRITITDRSAKGADTLCQEEFDKGCAALEELVIKAEVAAYEPKHAAILQKQKDSVTPADKEALLSAITDMEGLSDGTKEYFEDKRTPADLAEKYKAIAKQEIENTLGSSTDARKDHLYALKDKLDDLSVSGKANDLPSIVESTDSLVKKAEALDKVFDRYEEIIASPEYQGFSDADKSAIDQTAKNVTDEIAKAEMSDEELAKLTEESLAKLDRNAAIGKINAAAAQRSDKTADTRAAIDKIIADTKVALEAETDPEKINDLAEKAIFDIKQEFDLQDMAKRIDETVSKINKLDSLTDDQKEEFEKKLRDLFEAEAERIRALDNDTAHKAALEDFYAESESIFADADMKNEEKRAEKKAEFANDINEAHAKLLEKINGMSYLSEEEREALKGDANVSLWASHAKLSEAKTAAEMTSIKNDALAELEWLGERGDLKNEDAAEAQRADATSILGEKAATVKKKINDAMHLTAVEKNALLADVDTLLADAEKKMDSATDTASLNKAMSDALEGLDAIAADCDAQELAGAKKAAIAELTAARDGIAAEINKSWFLEDEDRAALWQTAATIHSEETANINKCSSLDEVSMALADGKDKLNAHKELCIEEEKQACLKALTPFIIGLAIALVVEAAALLILRQIYKKKTGETLLFSLAPVPVFALALNMPTPLAWTLTILLGLMDGALAVFTVYYIVKLCKLPRDEEPEEEETEEEDIPLLEEGEDTPLLEEGEDIKPVPKETEELPESKQKPRLKARPKLAMLFAAPSRPRLEPKPQLVYLMPPAMPEIVGLITAKEADMLISDEDAFHCEETNIVNTEVYTGKRKAAVNIYTISQNFEVGDLVSINTLKEKGLISKKVGHVKILGKGYLDKPLTVVAQNFSASAIKMIVLTGGKAILAEGSPERKKKKR